MGVRTGGMGVKAVRSHMVYCTVRVPAAWKTHQVHVYEENVEGTEV